MSQETNSAVYLLAQKQRRWRRAALVTSCQVNDSLHQWILREVSVCTDWASPRKETERGERLCKNNNKKKKKQTGGTKKKTKTHQTRMRRTLPLILSWAKRRRQSLSVTQKKPCIYVSFTCSVIFWRQGVRKRSISGESTALLILPPECVFCNPCKCG